jgi:TolB protein
MKKSLFFSCGLVILFVIICSATQGYAQTDIYIRGSGRLFPIALPRLCLSAGSGSANQDIPNTIARDLDLSGYFEVLQPNTYIETPGKCTSNEATAYSDWTVIGAEGLVRGVVSYSGSKVKVQLYLHDVQKNSVVLGKEYEGDAAQVPMMAHRFANEILKFFTGEYGPFGSSIAFSSKIGRFKELFVMDLDGSNLRQLTNERSLAMSPAWNADGSKISFTSYHARMPDLFIMDVNSRKTTQVTNGPALELGAKFTKDGTRLLGSRTLDGESDILLLATNGSVIKRLTPANGGAIDVSPDWSPDESRIVFCSNRGGGPQIYTMNSDGSGVKRLSYVTSNYCTSPSWSPKGDKIAFVCRADAGFQLFVTNADGGEPLQLTSSGDNEDPDWSPDGRYIAFSSTISRNGTPRIAMIRADGANFRELTSGRIGDSMPSWGPLPF